MAKKVTNEKLALMIKNGFDEVHKKIDGVNNNLESRIDQIDRKLDAEVERHDDQDSKIKNHEERIIILEKKDKILT